MRAQSAGSVCGQRRGHKKCRRGRARRGRTRFLYISTASVFKGDHGDYREEDAPEPTNAYNESKREANGTRWITSVASCCG